AVAGVHFGDTQVTDASAWRRLTSYRVGKESASPVFSPKKFFHSLTQPGVANAYFIKVSTLLSGRQFQGRVKDFNLAIRWLRHGQISSSTFQCDKTGPKGAK